MQGTKFSTLETYYLSLGRDEKYKKKQLVASRMFKKGETPL